VSVSLGVVDAQEDLFATAFAAGHICVARSLYAPDAVYVSPTTRLFGWPPRIVGIEQVLEFIQLTITGLSDISYGVDERALIADGAGDAGAVGAPGDAGAVGAAGDGGAAGAYVRVRFDFDMNGARLRSTYVVVYRYRDSLIAQQELYYDPSGELERLPSR
jgi:ketosteroid isomerase-like protein